MSFFRTSAPVPHSPSALLPLSLFLATFPRNPPVSLIISHIQNRAPANPSFGTYPSPQGEADKILAGSAGRKCITFTVQLEIWLCV